MSNQNNSLEDKRTFKSKIFLAFSPGGHYVESMQIMNALNKYEVYYLTPYAPTTRKLNNVYFITDTAELGLPRSMILNIMISFKIFFKLRPKVIITTGAEIVIPICYLAKLLFRAKIIFIETFARVLSPSVTGRIIYPIADVFLVQWKTLIKCYGRKAKYVGRVF